MEEMQRQHLFGPVPSRRLGRSLGLDLTPFKTCNFDCIFCQLGRTTHKTSERQEYIPVDAVIAELAAWLKTGEAADYITLAGSGEPTLNAGFGRVLEYVRGATDIPVALLTNGALLADPDVRAQAAQAQVVKVSLSAWDPPSLERLNRPHPAVDFNRLIEGQRRFRSEFRGELWVEVFLVQGINTSREEVAAIAALVKSIAPDKVQLNTAVRPPCEAYAGAVPEADMGVLAKLFDPAAEVIAEYSSASSAKVQATEQDVLELLERRPCTLEQLCAVFGLHRNEASKYVGKLLRTEQIVEHREKDESYYAGVHNRGRP